MSTPEHKNHDIVQLAHGGGGRLMQNLIREIFEPAFGPLGLDTRHDAAICTRPPGQIACATDSFVVDPLFFPGGDIGCLAVYGTVNDLAMRGARPIILTAGFIIEEGFPVADLKRIAQSMAEACARAGVSIVTGDTKVVERGHGHGVYINTAGIGYVEHDLFIGPASIRCRDTLILSGDLGRHGISIIATREELALETAVLSDCAPLHTPISRLLESGIDIHCLRDLTRGGLTSALVEISETCGAELVLDQAAIPVLPQVMAACELIGLDPLSVANEGRFVAFVPPDQAAAAVAVIRETANDTEPVVIGTVRSLSRPLVTLRTEYGTERVLDMLNGDQLPRIC